MNNNPPKKRGSINVPTKEEYLRQRAASGEPITIKLTNHVAFRKVFNINRQEFSHPL